jgi:hypothetical protein
MVIVSNNWRLYLAGLAVSLAIFAVLFFTVIKPSTDTANQAVKTGLQQTQQALNQAQNQVSSATTQASTTASNASQSASTAGNTASSAVNNATKLTSCLASAGTDTSKIESCQSKYGG